MKTEENVHDAILLACVTTAIAGFADPSPGGVDVPVLIGSWITMTAVIARSYDVPFDKNMLKNLLIQSIKGGAIFIGGTKALLWLLKLTGFGYLGGGIINAALNGLYTLHLGLLFKKTWSRGSQPPTASEITSTLLSAMRIGRFREFLEAFRLARAGLSIFDKDERRQIFQKTFSEMLSR